MESRHAIAERARACFAEEHFGEARALFEVVLPSEVTTPIDAVMYAVSLAHVGEDERAQQIMQMVEASLATLPDEARVALERVCEEAAAWLPEGELHRTRLRKLEADANRWLPKAT